MKIQRKTPSSPSASIKTPQELVHIKHKISLRQYKYWVLILKSYRESYEQGVTPNEGGFFYLPTQLLSEHLGYEVNKTELRADMEALRKESIIYNLLGKDGQSAQRGSGFISEWEVSSNWVGYKLPDFLLKCVERLDLKNAIFQQLNWTIFNSFSGKYEAIIYKLCKDYVGVQRSPYMTIAVFRNYMGLRDTEYAEFKDLNKFVISGPIKKINVSKVADIEIEVVLTKERRKVVGLQFLVKRRHQLGLAFGDEPAFASARITISLAQQKKYLAETDASVIALAIERANCYIDDQLAKGTEVNPGAIYHTAIIQGWGKEQQAQLDEEFKKDSKKKVEEQAQIESKQREAKAEEDRAAMRRAAKERFDALDLDAQSALIDAFGRTLKGFPLATFNKSGVTSAMLAPTFAMWLAEIFR